MKRTLIIIGAVLILLVIGFFAYSTYQRGQAARSAGAGIQTAVVNRGSLIAQVGASGTVRSNQSAMLNWQASGTVGEVMVRVGQQVSKGEELASLATSSLPQSIIMAQVDQVNAQKALDDLMQSQSAAAQARQAVDKAQQALDDYTQNFALQQAQALDALVKAQQAYTDTVQARTNLNFLASSPKANDARTKLEQADGLVNQLQQIYNSLPGDPQTNPEKARALYNLRVARVQRDAAQRNYDLYGSAPSNVELQKADTNVLLAEAKMADARSVWDHVKDGPNPVDQALLEAQLADAKRAYDRIKDGPNPDDIAAAKSRLAASQAALEMAHITAPFGGVITIVNAKPGDQVGPSVPAFRLDDLSHLLVDVDVSEVDINQVQPGQSAVLTFDSILGKEYHGKVTEVASVGQTDQGVVNFTVTVELTDADAQVKPGMTAAVSVVVTELKDVLLVPNRAVRAQDGKRVVYVARNNTYELVEVILGNSNDTDSAVTGGSLKQGDTIVINPSSLAFMMVTGSRQNGGGGGPFGGGRP
ncbi:MAG: efflux RND transporter periplasmic adaptor subunit [Omnitrophica WOR_2 bacterium]